MSNGVGITLSLIGFGVGAFNLVGGWWAMTAKEGAEPEVSIDTDKLEITIKESKSRGYPFLFSHIKNTETVKLKEGIIINSYNEDGAICAFPYSQYYKNTRNLTSSFLTALSEKHPSIAPVIKENKGRIMVFEPQPFKG